MKSDIQRSDPTSGEPLKNEKGSSSNTGKSYQEKPWDFFRDDLQRAPILDGPTGPAQGPAVEKSEEVRLSTSMAWIAERIQQDRLKILGVLAIFLSGNLWYASTIPVTYFSTLHLYAPEKTDTIGTRLSLFTQKLEFASFPVDYKTPVSLMSRRLREDEAAQWVAKQLQTDPQYAGMKDKIKAETIAVETNYVPTQEILAIEGYANTPEAASVVTMLYWKYLSQDLRSFELEQQTKTRLWFDLTNSSIEKQIDLISDEIERISPRTYQKNSINKVQDSVSSSISESELRRSYLNKVLSELAVLDTTPEFTENSDSVEPEIRSRLRIYARLKKEKELVSEVKLQSTLNDLHEAIRGKIIDTRNELRLLEHSRSSSEQEMSRLNLSENHIRIASEQEADLRTQLISLRNLKGDLIKFKSQLEMESQIRTPQFRPIHYPQPNPSSVRPLPVVKYGMAMVIALLMTVGCFSLFYFSSYWKRSRRFSLAG